MDIVTYKMAQKYTDTAIQSHQDISGKEDKENKVTSIDNTSTDTQYPSAKCLYDSQATQNDEIEALQAGNERLRNTLSTTTGTGQVITLNKTAELEFVKSPLPMGNSEQVQYSGKNLLNLTNLTERTTNGVTFTPVYENRLLKYINVNGTATANANYYFGQDSIVTLESGTYTWGGSATDINLGINFGDTYYNTSSSRQITLSETATSGQPYIQVPNGKSISNVRLYPQLELGNSATSYEPYTYGQAPNPNFEVPITNVTGDVEVVVENKNLAWNGWAEDFVRRINAASRAIITELDNRNCLEYLASAGWKEYDKKYIFKTNFKENTQYTFMFDMFTSIHSGNIYIEYTDGTTSGIRNLSTTAWNNVKMVSSPNKTIKYLRASYDSGNSWIDLDTFMVYEGTQEIDFIPHKEQTFTFPLGNEKLMLGDYLADDGKHHVREKYTITGQENGWQYDSSLSSPTDRTVLRISNLINYKSNNYLSNRFISGSESSNRLILAFVGSSRTIYLSIENSIVGIETEDSSAIKLSKIKAWLAENPTIIEYELEEEQEVIVPYTSAQQEVYNQIKQALSYEGQTNISSNQNAIFNVEAYQSTKLILESIDSRLTLVEG